MSLTIRACSSVEELRQALNAISHYFASDNTLEEMERFGQWLPVERMHAAWEGDRIVGGAVSSRSSSPCPEARRSLRAA